MEWMNLVGRLLVARIRFLVYVAFIASMTVFFYWIGGGFETRQLDPASAKSVILLQKPNKIDVQYPPLVKRYCNYPISNLTHDALEDAGSTNLRLRGLIIVTRHGDRAPLLPFPQHLNVPRCGLWSKEDADLFHHYRNELTKSAVSGLPIDQSVSVFASFLTAPPNEKCRPGHLTAVGATQLIRLGRRLRDHYEKSWSFPFVSSSVNRPTECKARSTMYPRTYQSGLAFMYGWTGNADGEIKSRDQANDHGEARKCLLRGSETTYFCTEPWCMCSNRIEGYRRDFHQKLATFTRKETKDKEVKEIIQKIGSVLETPKLEDPLSAIDSLMGWSCHQEAMPCVQVKTTGKESKEDVCVHKNWLTQLFVESKNAEMAASQSEAGKKLAAVESAPILIRLAQLAGELASSPEKSVFEYLSGHDVTLRPLLIALGLWDGSIPPYASYLAFELVEDKVQNQGLFFRVIYNGEDLSEKVSNAICKNGVLSRYNEGVFKLCSLNGLMEYAKRFVTVLGDGEKRHGEEWAKLCR